MAVLILCEGAPILRVKNSTFEILYNNILELAENIPSLPLSVEELIDDLYTGCHGIGNDVSNFLKNYEDALFFAEILKKAVHKMENETPSMQEDTRRSLQDFYEAMFAYTKHLKYQN